MTPEDVRSVVSTVLEEESHRRGKQLDEVVMKAVATILTGFGIDDKDRQELRSDFEHLRRWRKSVEQAQTYGMKAIITVLVTGFLGALWMGVKASLGK